MGPFILLIERTPADVWLTILSWHLLFVHVKREGYWLKHFWVKAGFAFWFWCILTGLPSDHAIYSMSEAFVWFRFPLFAMATAFWLGQDKRLLYAMLMSTAFGLLIICFILTAEYLIVGQQYIDRLSWPYGDMVPGNYLAKAGLPAFLVIVALAVSIHGRLSGLCGFLIIFSMTISVIAGNINFLIRACSGLLAAVFWETKDLAVDLITDHRHGNGRFYFWSLILILQIDFTKEFIVGITNFEDSGWMHVMYGGT